MLRRTLTIITISFSLFFIITPKTYAGECCPPDYFFSTGNNKCRMKNGLGRITSVGEKDIQCVTATEMCDYFNPPSALDSVEVDHPEWMYYRGSQCIERTKISPTGSEIKAGGGKVCNDGQVSTAIGCIEYSNPASFATQFIRYGVGIGSGIAFLLIIFGSYKMISSQGIPEGLNQGREIITSAIIGLVFIILTVTMIQIIGFDILGLGTLGLGTR